jgi:hypothetical protein
MSHISQKVKDDLSNYKLSIDDKRVIQTYLEHCIETQTPHELPTIPVYVQFGAKYVQEITCIVDAFALSFATRVVYLNFNNFNTIIERVSVEFDRITQRGNIERIQAKLDQLETIYFSRDVYFANVMESKLYHSEEDLYQEHCSNCNTFVINSNIKHFPNILSLNLSDNRDVYTDTRPSIYDDSTKSGLIYFRGIYGSGNPYKHEENRYVFNQYITTTIVDIDPIFEKSLVFLKKLAIAMPLYISDTISKWLTPSFFEHTDQLEEINIGTDGRRVDPIDDIFSGPVKFPKISHLKKLKSVALYGLYLEDISFLNDCSDLYMYVSDVGADEIDAISVPKSVEVNGNRHEREWQINC